MVKLKLFHRSKKDEEISLGDKSTTKENQERQKRSINQKTQKTPEQTPIKEYNETLYSSGSAQTYSANPSAEKIQRRRISWENAETIEQNIDAMSQEQSEISSGRTRSGSNTEKKVDFILLKKKNR